KQSAPPVGSAAMFRVPALVLLGVALVAAPPADAKRSKKTDQLLRVIAPVARGTAAAHPFVNVIARFDAPAGVAPADPDTFRARIGKTALHLDPIVENGKTVGMRGTIEAGLLKIGPRRTNLLKLEVHTAPSKGHPKGQRDVDRVRFRAAEA